MKTTLLFKNSAENSRVTAGVILDTVCQGIEPEFMEGACFSSLVVEFDEAQVATLKAEVAKMNLHFRTGGRGSATENVFLVEPIPVLGLETIVHLDFHG